MATLLIVYHSMTGGTQQMAAAAAAGAGAEPGVRVALLGAADAQASAGRFSHLPVDQSAARFVGISRHDNA